MADTANAADGGRLAEGEAEMAASGSADTVLKILSGVQSGVDIVLAEGDYALGSGDDDDIQLFDVSLSPAHVRIAIRNGKVEIAGGAGSLKTGNGIALEPGGDLQEIEPLDIVTAGASRFALGPTTANWASIVNVGGFSQPFPAAPPQKSGRLDLYRLMALPDRKTLLPVAIVLLIAVALFAISSRFSLDQQPQPQEAAKTSLELVNASLEKFAFANRLETRQELDGAVFVTGYVTTPVERRAALAAIRDTEVPAKIRISVTDMIRNEISNFLDTENTELAFDLSETGELTLSGIMLDADRLEQLVGTIRERILGISAITSQVRTGASLLQDVQALAERSQIVPFVLLRRDGELIEASGVIPLDKIDAWAGFLQAYSSQLAPIIALRSLVVLQDPSRPDGVSGDEDHKALFLGADDKPVDGLSVDVNRLKAGSFDLSDIFVGQPRQPSDGAVSISTPPNQTPWRRPAAQTAQAANGSIIDLEAILGGDRTQEARPPAAAAANEPSGQSKTPEPAGRPVRVVDLTGGSAGGNDQGHDLQLQEDAIRSAGGMQEENSAAAADRTADGRNGPRIGGDVDAGTGAAAPSGTGAAAENRTGPGLDDGAPVDRELGQPDAPRRHRKHGDADERDAGAGAGKRRRRPRTNPAPCLPATDGCSPTCAPARPAHNPAGTDRS